MMGISHQEDGLNLIIEIGVHPRPSGTHIRSQQRHVGPLRMNWAPTSSAKCINKPSKGCTLIIIPACLEIDATSASTMATRSAREKSGFFASLIATPIINWSTSLAPRSIISRWPLVIGSKGAGIKEQLVSWSCQLTPHPPLLRCLYRCQCH